MLHHLIALHALQPHALEYFSEVVETGSLRLAAQKFDVAPSAVSRQIARLEQDLGQDLFERSPKGMLPTAAARLVLEFLTETRLRAEKMRADINDLTDLKRGNVRLAVVEALSSDFLADLLRHFSDANPGIEFRIAVCGTHEIADRVVSGKADIGLAFNVLNRDDLILQGRVHQPLQLICNPQHVLAHEKLVPLSALDGARAALPTRSFGIRYLIDQAAIAANISMKVAYESDSLAMLKAMVRRSDRLISFMPPLTFAHELEMGVLRAVDLSDAAAQHASIDVVTARQQALSVAARAFLALVLARIHRPPA